MSSDSTSNSQFSGFSSQAPMTPEQQAFLQTQQEAFIAFQQNFQNIQANPPQQQSQSSNSFSQQTDSQPKRSESTGDVTLRWSSDEEALLAECYVAVSEDRNVRRSQANDTFWVRVMHEFNRKNFQKRTKDMLTSKWSTLNHHCQKFNAIYKRCHRLKKSGENEAAEKAFEASKDKDETIKSLEELRFLALSTKDLSEDDSFWIDRKKAQIKAKLHAEMPMEPNNEDDSDE
nr:hypothetical protein [Tanacetum cinerariifolium]